MIIVIGIILWKLNKKCGLFGKSKADLNRPTWEEFNEMKKQLDQFRTAFPSIEYHPMLSIEHERDHPHPRLGAAGQRRATSSRARGQEPASRIVEISEDADEEQTTSVKRNWQDEV